jgi:hypothetical protein
MFMDRNRSNGGPNDHMDGFASIAWHGGHDGGVGSDRDILVSVDVAKDCRGGQFEVYFCSTACLRAFFNSWVDALEAQVLTKKKRPSKRHKPPK